ncbi:hypothetical protein AB0L06_20900 [Spirillospora sp. NPDC052269]
MRTSKSARRAFCATAVAAAALGLAAAPAQARQAAPTGIPTFDYADCPALPAGADALSSFCFEAIASSESVTIGNVTHLINSPFKATFGSPWFDDSGYGSNIFGGLRTEPFQVSTRNGEPVYARVESAGASDLTPTLGLNLNFKIRFTGGGLGSNCTVGTDGNPISAHLITGTTTPPSPYQPITGVPWTVAAPGVHQGTVVDNTFPVPAASGCGDSGNAFLNQLGGLPAPAGASSIVLPTYMGAISYSKLP